MTGNWMHAGEAHAKDECHFIFLRTGSEE